MPEHELPGAGAQRGDDRGTLRLYLDCSIFSALYDERTPDRQAMTRRFWTRLADYSVATSDVTRDEMRRTRDLVHRAALESLLEGLLVHPFSDDMRALSRRYISAGLFGITTADDARHVAAAVVSRHDCLVSWNFRHLVNKRRIAVLNQLNGTWGLPPLVIVSPLDMEEGPYGMV